jgi:F-type H+-transporting ATPase subunit c
VQAWLALVWPAQLSAADSQFGRLVFGFAVTEALGIFSLLVALLLLFAV